MKYYVEVKEVHNQNYLVEADNPDEAKELVNQLRGGEGKLYDNGKVEEDYMVGELVYNYTREPDEWRVYEAKE